MGLVRTCHHQHHHQLSLWVGAPLPLPAPSILFIPSLPIRTQRSSCRGVYVCVCDQNLWCLFEDLFILSVLRAESFRKSRQVASSATSARRASRHRVSKLRCRPLLRCDQKREDFQRQTKMLDGGLVHVSLVEAEGHVATDRHPKSSGYGG